MNDYVFPFHLVPQNSSIVLYSAGDVAQCFYKQLLATDYAKVVLWVSRRADSYQEKRLPVQNKEKLKTAQFDYLVLAIEKPETAEEVRKELTDQYDIPSKKIIWCAQYGIPADGVYRNRLEEISEMDRLLFDGELRKSSSPFETLDEDQMRCLENLYNSRLLRGKRSKVVQRMQIAVKDLFLAQYHESDFQNYKHCDAAVRLLALEEYYGKNDYGFDMYRRMQIHSGFDWNDRYKNLIGQLETADAEKFEPIEVSRHFAILDGSHRSTIALYRHLEFLDVIMYDSEKNRDFDMNLFWQLGFSDKECQIIRNKTNEILHEANYEFVGVIWPPAVKFADDILSEIPLWGEKKLKITWRKDYHLTKGDFERLLRALYHTDILTDEGATQKIAMMEACVTEQDDFTICAFRVKCDNPQIGLNPKNNMPQSQVITRLKAAFRTRYAPYIPGYQYDISLHVTDNYLQSEFCRQLLNVDKDISSFFADIQEYRYVAVRTQQGAQHMLFPKNFYYRSDIDILAPDAAELEQLTDRAYCFACRHFSGNWIKIVKRKAENGSVHVEVWLKDYRIFMFDFTPSLYGLNNAFSLDCVNRAIDGAYKTPPIENEVIIRAVEYIHKPRKTWHRDYVREHMDLLDKERLMAYLNRTEISEGQITDFLENLQQ